MGEKILQSLHARPPRRRRPTTASIWRSRPPSTSCSTSRSPASASRALAAVLDMLILIGACAGRLICIGILSGFGFTLGRVGTGAPGARRLRHLERLLHPVRGPPARARRPASGSAGIRVVMDTGHAVTFGAATARNLLRVADFLPPPYLIGLLLVAFHPRGKRLGDLVAGTDRRPGPAAGARRRATASRRAAADAVDPRAG